MTSRLPTHLTTRIGAFASHPAAFLLVLVYGVFWYVFDPATFNWAAVATLAVWCMTLFIQRADRRDTLAVHAKLDELLTASHKARTEFAQIDEEEPEDIERIRDREKRAVAVSTRPEAQPARRTSLTDPPRRSESHGEKGS